MMDGNETWCDWYDPKEIEVISEVDLEDEG